MCVVFFFSHFFFLLTAAWIWLFPCASSMLPKMLNAVFESDSEDDDNANKPDTALLST